MRTYKCVQQLYVYIGPFKWSLIDKCVFRQRVRVIVKLSQRGSESIFMYILNTSRLTYWGSLKSIRWHCIGRIYFWTHKQPNLLINIFRKGLSKRLKYMKNLMAWVVNKIIWKVKIMTWVLFDLAPNIEKLTNARIGESSFTKGRDCWWWVSSWSDSSWLNLLSLIADSLQCRLASRNRL